MELKYKTNKCNNSFHYLIFLFLLPIFFIFWTYRTDVKRWVCIPISTTVYAWGCLREMEIYSKLYVETFARATSKSKLNFSFALLTLPLSAWAETRQWYSVEDREYSDFWPPMHYKKGQADRRCFVKWAAPFLPICRTVPRAGASGLGGPFLSTDAPDLHGRLISEKG